MNKRHEYHCVFVSIRVQGIRASLSNNGDPYSDIYSRLRRRKLVQIS